MKTPQFMCMGFQKCGTTTLYEILKQHPDVALCRDIKEPMFYRAAPVRPLFGKKYYLNRYYGHIDADDPRLSGEVNAGLTYTHCAEKISKDFAPNLKLIFMVRNPVGRCYSAYKYFLARGFLPAKFMKYDAVHGHAEGFDHYVHYVLDNPGKRSRILQKRLKYLVFSQSCYATCVEEYLEHFPQENIKIVCFEEFVRDVEAGSKDIFTFLGLDTQVPINYHIQANEGNERATSPFKSRRLLIGKSVIKYGWGEFLHMNAWAPGFYKQCLRLYSVLRSTGLEADPDKSAMLPQTKELLTAFYEPEVRKLEKITGRDMKTLWF